MKYNFIWNYIIKGSTITDISNKPSVNVKGQLVTIVVTTACLPLTLGDNSKLIL